MSPVLTAIALASVLATSPPAPRTAENGLQPKSRAAQQSKSRVAKQASPGPRTRLVAAARQQVGKRFRGDCSAFVRHVYAKARVPLPQAAKARSGTEAIVKKLTPARRPRPGDIAYFHRTHDRDRPGTGRNLYTHIGVVERVRGQQVTLIHRSNKGVERLQLHLGRRGDPKVNDVLRRKKRSDPPAQRYLAGQLLAGFASPFATAPEKPKVAARTPPKQTKATARRR